MSTLQLNRIKKVLESKVLKHIDKSLILKEKPKASEGDIANMMFSQGFLLYSLKCLTGASYLDLKNYITDGFFDNGIDAVYYSNLQNELFICQSKWIKKGKGGVDKGEILKFIKGIEDLLHLRFSEFNNKLQKHSEIIENVILSPNIKINVVLCYTGNNLSDENNKLIVDKLAEFNDTDEDIFFKEYKLGDAYTYLKDSVEGEPINTDIDLFDWGKISEPYKSFYGTVSCGQIAELLEVTNRRIYSKNIRSFIGLTGINSSIVKTLVKEPEKFFYLNNGIVLLCKEIKKSPYSSGKREIGKFHLTDLSVVNGAQTVGAINYAFQTYPDKVNSARVFIKIVSLEGAPSNFDKNITVASNTQNKIEKRDFVSLDSQQNRLLNEFYLSGLKYHLKRDDKDLNKDSTNYYFEEATICLACFQDDVDFPTYAKREIGKLWEDKAYSRLFNDKVNVISLVNLINIFRKIEQEIKLKDANQRLIYSHGVYLLTHIIYTAIGKSKLLNPSFEIDEYLNNDFKTDFTKYANRLWLAYQSVSPNNKFPLSIFKNFKYNRTMKDDILNLRKESHQMLMKSLFDELE